MPEDAKPDKSSTDKIANLANALAEKGPPGIILLAIIFLTIWLPVWPIIWKFFEFIGTAKDFSQINGLVAATLAVVTIGGLGVGYVFMAYRLTCSIMQSIIPTIKAEAEATHLMSGAFGGRVVTSSGAWQTLAIDPAGAQARTKQIMTALLERAKTVVSVERVRANIFILREDGRLHISDSLHINMRGGTLNDTELTISIPTGHLSSGRAFAYFRPVLSIKKDGVWPYASDAAALQQELQKTHQDLKWIVSMPIPYQVQPFKLTSGVLNIDGLEGQPSTQQLRALYTDLSTAAALIGVLNRSTGFLGGNYSKPSQPSDTEQETLKDFLISPEEFDPALCPEPSKDFVLALSNIAGLEFLKQISPLEVAVWLRAQLRS